MPRLAVAFLAVALVAGLFGFDLIPGLASPAARVVFFVSLPLAVVAFAADAFHGQGTTRVPT